MVAFSRISKLGLGESAAIDTTPGRSAERTGTMKGDTGGWPGAPRTRTEAVDVRISDQLEPVLTLEHRLAPDPEGGEVHDRVGWLLQHRAQGLLALWTLRLPSAR